MSSEHRTEWPVCEDTCLLRRCAGYDSGSSPVQCAHLGSFLGQRGRLGQEARGGEGDPEVPQHVLLREERAPQALEGRKPPLCPLPGQASLQGSPHSPGPPPHQCPGPGSTWPTFALPLTCRTGVRLAGSPPGGWRGSFTTDKACDHPKHRAPGPWLDPRTHCTCTPAPAPVPGALHRAENPPFHHCLPT